MKALEQLIDDVLVDTAVRQVSVNVFGYDHGRWSLFIEFFFNILSIC